MTLVWNGMSVAAALAGAMLAGMALFELLERLARRRGALPQ